MLKIVMSKPRPFGGTDFTEHESEINKALSEGHIAVIAQYIHGQAEEDNHYDIGLFLNAENCFDEEKEEYIPGIYNVEIVGYSKPCMAFLWKTEGRIVAIDDSESMKYAEIKYRNNI